MTLRSILEELIEDHVVVLEQRKKNLEQQITQDTGKEQELQEAFLEQRREKLADTIKRLNILKPLTDEERNTTS